MKSKNKFLRFPHLALKKAARSGTLFLALQILVVSSVLANPALVGQWSSVVDLPALTVHMSVLPNGKVLFWSNESKIQASMTWVWDVDSGEIAEIPNNNTNLFCTGHSFLPDGRLLATGGHFGFINEDYVGEPHTNIFDYRNNTWTRGPDMNAGRWYPSNLTLASGDVLTIAGQIDVISNQNKLPQIWSHRTNEYRNLTGAIKELPLYPWTFLAPNGKVFIAGPDTETFFLDTAGFGQWSPGPASSGGYRDYGTSVMYEQGKILITGGGTPMASAEKIDLNGSSPVWSPAGTMNFARRQTNGTVLADGKVLLTGGTSSMGFNKGLGSVYPAEMWDPATNNWTLMSAMIERRLYHSAAMLLPDGRVLVSGGGRPAAIDIDDYNHTNAEIFSPPYLFKGARPVIANATFNFNYGRNVTIETPDAASIAKVNLVRLSSVTHSFNQSQMLVTLPFQASAGRLTATIPANPNILPPGHYMMFIINSNGVPSVSKIVKVAHRKGAYIP
jgi:hypothetical protein